MDAIQEKLKEIAAELKADDREKFLSFGKFLSSRHEKSKEKNFMEISDRLFAVGVLTNRLNNLFTVLVNNYFCNKEIKSIEHSYNQIQALIYTMDGIAIKANRLTKEVMDDLEKIKA